MSNIMWDKAAGVEPWEIRELQFTKAFTPRTDNWFPLVHDLDLPCKADTVVLICMICIIYMIYSSSCRRVGVVSSAAWSSAHFLR